MTAIINASNTSGITFTSDTSGNLALQSNGTTVATITGSGANAGIQMGSAFAPAFSAYQSSAQSIPNASFTKLQLQTKVFDTANCFDNSTNYRFTPTVAGYYQINGQVSIGGASSGYSQISIYKSGAEYSRGSVSINNTAVGAQSTVSNILYLNGSSDYVELYVYQNSGGSVSNQNNTFMNYFSGALVRSA